MVLSVINSRNMKGLHEKMCLHEFKKILYKQQI